MHNPTLAVTVLLASSALASSAFAVDYLSAEQARKLLLPAAAQWQDKTVALTPTQLAAVSKLAGLSARSAAWFFRGSQRRRSRIGCKLVSTLFRTT